MSQPRDDRQDDLFRPALEEIINLRHPLVRLAAEIDWGFLAGRFGSVCRAGPGQPPLPTRLVAGLFILKHMHLWGNLLPEWKHAFGSVEKIQSGDFVSLWTARIDHFANRFSAARDSASQDGASTQTSGRSQARRPTTVAHGNLRTSQPHARHRVAAADRKLSVPATAQQLKGSRIALARTRSGHAKAAKRATAS
jgi:hypothetical protein